MDKCLSYIILPNPIILSFHFLLECYIIHSKFISFLASQASRYPYSSSTSIYNYNTNTTTTNNNTTYNKRPSSATLSTTTSQYESKEGGSAGWTTVSTNLSTSGRPPCERSLHASAVLHDSLYVFGGYDGLSRVNDFYEFHFPSRCWREIITLNGTLVDAAAGAIWAVGAGGGGGGGAIGMGGGNGENRGSAIGHPHHPHPAAGGGAAHAALLGAVVTATGTSPSPRDRHAAVAHRSSIYIFGGFDGTSRVSDLYEFDVERLVWREVRPRMSNNTANNNNNNINNNNNNIAAENNFAAARGGTGNNAMGQPPILAQMQAHPVGGGGEGDRAAAAAAAAAAHPPQFHPPPSPRHSHAAVVYKNFMYIFGGYDGSYRSDFHEFDLDQLTWRPVLSVSGRSPRARYRSTACVRRDMMILFGGHDGTRHLADVHLFDFVNQSWSLLVAAGVPPMPRDSHVSVTYRDSMYVFGGE
jgi:hypothetical protein